MGQREEEIVLGGSGQEPEPFTGEYMSVEEACAWLDQWTNRWNEPVLPKRKGLPSKGGTSRVEETRAGGGRAITPRTQEFQP